MPWNEVSAVDLREEFAMLALSEGSNKRELCRRYSISPTTGYKWLARHAAEGRAGLHDRSRRPGHSPVRTPDSLEARVLALRDEHPAWGGRKLRRRLHDLGVADAPSASTITAILRRNGRLDGERSAAHRPFVRFEHAAPNDLWQMDFKGHFATGRGRCHPLTVLDDHSRFSVCLEACADERAASLGVEIIGQTIPSAPASSSFMSMPGSFQGTRAMGRAPCRAIARKHSTAEA